MTSFLFSIVLQVTGTFLSPFGIAISVVSEEIYVTGDHHNGSFLAVNERLDSLDLADLFFFFFFFLCCLETIIRSLNSISP